MIAFDTNILTEILLGNASIVFKVSSIPAYDQALLFFGRKLAGFREPTQFFIEHLQSFIQGLDDLIHFGG